ncbi:MAG: excinuclease ABC subunit UvrC [Ardenticatenaceae bacterium]|nr:excinuclease ABC subunit UvrC [Ardenticatenaceae bacterium]
MSETIPPHIKEQLDTLPSRPGVYQMKERRGVVLYVGKAINLRNRVRSYWNPQSQRVPKIRRLTGQVETIDVIPTESELEALLLENNLIKQYKPRYNVRLKDDKSYPYIKVTWSEDFPKVFPTRQMTRDGSRYFGPYTSVWAVRQTLDLLRKRFPYLTCNRTITGQDDRACLYYHINLCSGPCIGAVSKEKYREIVQGLMDFLEGEREPVLEEIRTEMVVAAENLEFERAAALRDQLQALEKISEHQKVVNAAGGDQDVIAFARADGDACVQVFFIRDGKLIGREYFVLEGTEDEADPEVMGSFLQQFYDGAPMVPPEILLPEEVDEAIILRQWLRSKRGADVVLRVPRNDGTDAQLLQMAAESAAETLANLKAQWAADENRHTGAIDQLQQALSLAGPPVRIECYDISHTQGTNVVGAMVVFEKGVPRKSDYRKFKLRNDQNDDFANMFEIVHRRFANWREAQRKPGGDKWAILPDLLVIDGGKGQLNAAVEVLKEFDLFEVVPVIGLAKREEEIFQPGVKEPIVLEKNSPALQLLQRARDEAHRFGVTYHRTLRVKKGLASQLETVTGIGPKRRTALLRHFGSLDAVRKASIEEIASVKGMNEALALKVKEQLDT